MRKFTPLPLRNLDHKPAWDIVGLVIVLRATKMGIVQSVQACVTA